MKKIWQFPAITRRAFLSGLMVWGLLLKRANAEHKKDDTPQITRQPYLQRCYENGVVILWYTDIPCESHVKYGTQVGALNSSYTVEGKRRRHVARINELDVNTRYYYSVGTTDHELAGNDSDYYFETAPPLGSAKPTRIWVLGDSGHPNRHVKKVRDSYYQYSAEQQTDMCLLLGDNAYPDGTEDEYQEALFDVFDTQLRKTTLWPAYGNHDAGCEDCVSSEQFGPFFSMFKTPTLGESGGEASNRRDFYSFDYGNIHVVCLNSHDGFGSHMIDWLRNDLESNQLTWLIAFWHHPPYSKGYHDSDTDFQMSYMRAAVVPVLEEYGVDLVLSGHNHNYERTYFMHGHYGTSDTLIESMLVDKGNGDPDRDGAFIKNYGREPGAVYVAMGCTSELKDGPLDHPAVRKHLRLHGSLIIDVNDDIMDVRFLDEKGESRDTFRIEKGNRNIYFPIATRMS